MVKAFWVSGDAQKSFNMFSSLDRSDLMLEVRYFQDCIVESLHKGLNEWERDEAAIIN